jgi:multidrug resistance efflux pump
MRPGRPATPPPFTFHIKCAMERAEADHAKAIQVRMARDVGAMFDELKAMADRHAELHADRARLQAELDQARAELARVRRPWWRRLLTNRSV